MSRRVRIITMTIAVSVFLFSGAMILKYLLQTNASAEYNESIIHTAVILPADESAPSLTYETRQPTETALPTATNEEAAEKALDLVPIQVDFQVLREQNQDIVAWIYCPDTPVNYPVVQAADNTYYLYRLMDGTSNTAGTLFMDYRNASDLSDWNSVIYGHNMKNGSMFGTLPKYKKQAYFEAHPVFYLLTPEQNYQIKLLAGFVAPSGEELYNALNPDGDEKERLMNRWLEDSDFDAGIQPDSDSRLITFSTCSYEYRNARYVLLGTLEEI